MLFAFGLFVAGVVVTLIIYIGWFGEGAQTTLIGILSAMGVFYGQHKVAIDTGATVVVWLLF